MLAGFTHLVGNVDLFHRRVNHLPNYISLGVASLVLLAAPCLSLPLYPLARGYGLRDIRRRRSVNPRVSVEVQC